MTKEEFSSRVTAAQGKLYRIARGYLRSEHDCLDAVAEAICKAWQKQHTLRRAEAFDTWLCRILTRECINIQRGQKRTVPLAHVPEAPPPPARDEELRMALDALPQKLRVVTVLHYMEGYGTQDVAAILRIPKGTVTSRLHEARLRLRQWMKEDTL